MNDPAHAFAQLIDAFNRGDWSAAIERAEPLLAHTPDHPAVRYVAGIASLELGQLPQAAAHLGRAAALAPDRLDVATHHARALLALEQRAAAQAATERALGMAQHDPVALDALGAVLTELGLHRRAAEVYARALQLAPNQATLHFNLAAVRVALGELALAEQGLEQCLACDPRFWRAHYSLAQLRRQTPERNHLARLEARLADAGKDRAALTCLHLALAKELEDLGRYAPAMRHMVQGKHAARPPRPNVRERDAAMFAALQRAFPGPVDVSGGASSAAPIFIVGMPRSGTTLVDRIVSSHRQVHSAGELRAFGEVLGRAGGSDGPYLFEPATIARAAQTDPRAIGEAYLAATTGLAGDRPHFIDKFPHNFLYAGFIARALPQARIVCLRRNPMDSCLSNFRQLFSERWRYFDYSFDLLDTAHYFVGFDRLMAHWRQVLPGRVLELSYEGLVQAQEPTTRALLEFCGLPWDDACLHFERNAAPVTTPSAVQVRTPIHAGSVERWRRYGALLDGVRDVLTEAGLAVDCADQLTAGRALPARS